MAASGAWPVEGRAQLVLLQHSTAGVHEKCCRRQQVMLKCSAWVMRRWATASQDTIKQALHSV